MRTSHSLPPDYFERMFASKSDPWDFETSDYEAAKYNVTLAALNNQNFKAGFEVGCANGVLTKRLAARCRSLLAIDVSPSALALAKARCADEKSVVFAEMTFPQQAPDRFFDLIVMSEVVYYWNASDIATACVFVGDHLASEGGLLLVHWIGDTDYPQTGDAAVNLMRKGLPHFAIERTERYDKYRLDFWRKP